MFYRFLRDDKCITERIENISFDTETDVLIGGLGTCGALAAICAAEQGAKVIGIDRLDMMGGIGTNASVWDYYFGADGGRYEEINKECFQMIKDGYASSDNCEDKNSIPGMIKGYVLEKAARKCGCELYYNCIILGLYMEDNSVVGIRCLYQGEVINIKAKVVIDTTGSALICRIAGVKAHGGRNYDGKTMRFSKTIGLKKGKYIRGFWIGYGYMDMADNFEFSEKLLSASVREPALYERYGEERMVYNSTILGSRESYGVETEWIYTFDEYIKGLKEKAILFYGFSTLDNSNHDIAYENKLQQDWRFISSMTNYGFSIPVPRKCLLPVGVENVIVAGKGMGLNHDMASCLRMKKDLEKCGEAIGVWAAMAVRKDIPVRDVDYGELKVILERSGCYNGSENVGVCQVKPGDNQYRVKAEFPENETEIKKVLSSQHPWLAIWNIYSKPELVSKEALYKWLNDENELLAKNTAIALGLSGDKMSEENLLKIVENSPEISKEHEFPQHYPDWSRAICLLGRMKSKKALPYLKDIVAGRAKQEAEKLPVDIFYKTADDFEFQFKSMAEMAIKSIETVVV